MVLVSWESRSAIGYAILPQHGDLEISLRVL